MSENIFIRHLQSMLALISVESFYCKCSEKNLLILVSGNMETFISKFQSKIQNNFWNKIKVRTTSKIKIKAVKILEVKEVT